MDQPDWNMEEVARTDLGRLYLCLEEIESESPGHDVSVEVAGPVVMPTRLGPNSDL